MRIRTQLVLAWLVLSVLPLTGIVLYSHHTSREALETAERREAATLAKQMDRRLGTIRNEIAERLADVSALPIGNIPANADGNANPVVGNILAAMGETASLVDALEFRPARSLPPLPAATAGRAVEPAPVTPAAEPAPVAPTEPAPAAPAPPAPPSPTTKKKIVFRAIPMPHPSPSARPEIDLDVDLQVEAGRETIIIDIPPVPRMPRFNMTQEQRGLIAEISRLGTELGTMNLTPEQRTERQKAIDAKQKELHKSLEATRKSFDAQLREAQKVLDAREAAIAQRNRLRDAERAERDRQREIQRRQREFEKQQAATATDVASAPPPEPAVVTPKPPAKAVATAAAVAPAAEARVRNAKELTPKEKEELKEAAKKSALLLGRRYDIPVRKEGAVVGQITAQLRTEEVVKRVLGGATEDRDEIPFAVDRERNIYTRNERDRAILARIGIIDRLRTGKTMHEIENWIVAFTRDEESGLRVGVARPVGENLRELRATAATNFGYGLALIAVALIGIVPLANHISRDVETVTKGAQRIAHGDLMTRLPVRSDNEIGQLSKAFNRMAEDLSQQQQRLVEQQRMAVEYERKSVELEEARRFQLSMLPKEVPRHARYDIAVATQTAAEVGGDYYDFHVAGDVLSVTIGDATGHGAKAGTMVTVIKTLFAGYNAGIEPGAFLGDAAEKIRRMDLGRMAMALSVARFDGEELTVASAGMPPVLVHRASGEVEELALEATPLGTLLGREYAQRTIRVHSGDTVLFLSDGFPELQDAAGHQLGYGAALSEFALAAEAPDAAGVIDALTGAARRWHGDAPPNDDITFVAVRVA